MNGKIKNFLNDYVSDNQKNIYLKPLSDIHLSPDDKDDVKMALYSLAGLAIFILILACINFINLSTASSNLRKKEIGVRKVVGASRKVIFGQFISESVLYAFISMILAVMLSALLLPSFNTVVQRQLSLYFLADSNFIVLLVIIMIASGIFSGIYPAVYLSSFKPAEIIKSGVFNPVKNRKGLLRKSLVTFQFFISLFLIITTLYVIKQVQYMNNKYLGFDKKDLLIVRVFGDRSSGDFLTLKNELLKNGNILDASVSSNAPFVGNWGKEITWEGSNENQKMNIMYNSVGYDFIDTYKMQIVKGRNFSRDFSTDKSACLINETACKQFGWDDPIGKRIDSNKFTIIGVVQDFHQYSVHSVIPAYYMTLNSEKLADNTLYSIRLQKGATKQTINFIRSEFKTFFPNSIVEASMFDTNLDIGTGTVWLTLEKLFSIFTIIAILIAANGLFGLVSFTSQRRIKEIGIRKVLGAKTSKLYWMMSSELIMILIIASILAIPAAYFQASIVPGAYKYQLHLIDYVQSIGILLFTALAATVYQTTKTVLANPVNALRYE